MQLRVFSLRSCISAFDLPCCSTSFLLVRSYCSIPTKSNFQPLILKSSRDGTTLNLDLNATKGDEKQKHSKQRGNKTIHWSAGAVAMLIIPVVTFCLGTWQVARLQWKLALIDSMKQRLLAAPLDFPEYDLSQLSNLEYKRVRVRGQFLHDKEFIIHLRGRFDPGYQPKGSGSLLSTEENTSHGGHVIVPFRLQKSGRIILVNRGWVPPQLFSRETRINAEPRGIVEFEAIVRRSEKRPQFVSKNAPEMGLWYYRDLEEMGEFYGTEPVMIDAVYETTMAGGPIGGQTNVSLRNEHLSYIVTWYGLCAATGAMWLSKFRK